MLALMMSMLALFLFTILGSSQALPNNNGTQPTVLQYIQKNVIDLPNWNNYLPDDIDTDDDGTLNEKEVELKFKSYVKDAFDQLDKDSDKLITRDEFIKASIDLDGINKVVDVAFQSFPLKQWLGYGDRDQNGYISEEDFVLSENRDEIVEQHWIKYCAPGECPLKKNYNPEVKEDVWTLRGSVPTFLASWGDQYLVSESFGQNEAEVLCRELGHKGVESVSSISSKEFLSLFKDEFDIELIYTYNFKFGCLGSESSLEECTQSKPDNLQRHPILASVNCALDKHFGEVHLAGGKDPSSGDLHIGNKKYCGNISPAMAMVVCTQLGFLQGVPQVTTNNFFTDFYEFPRIPNLQREFICNGSEEKLQDCQLMLATHYDNEEYEDTCLSNGIFCNLGNNLSENYEDVASSYDSKSGFHSWWEIAARHLFIADTNGDRKVSMEELHAKTKDIVGAVFHLLDQTRDTPTRDGVLSVSDFTTINVKLPAVIDLANKLFEVATKGKGEINLIKLKLPVGVSKILEGFEMNGDGIINLKDFSDLGESSQIHGLLSILSRNVDLNQDGIILKEELENYLRTILKHLDENNNDAITLNDVYKLMQKSQFTCLQIEGVQTFIDGWRWLIDAQAEKFLAYMFTEFDLDDNGKIVLEELYKAHAPCDQNANNQDWNPRNQVWNSSNRIPCGSLKDVFLYVNRPRRPSMVFRGLGPGAKSYEEVLERSTSRSYGAKIALEEKIANFACISMQPPF